MNEKYGCRVTQKIANALSREAFFLSPYAPNKGFGLWEFLQVLWFLQV